MILYLDTSDNKKSLVKLDDLEIEKTYQTPRSQEVLRLIEEALKKKKASLKDLTEIKVNVGPGSFTGLRIGITVANTLAWILGIKVNGKKFVLPDYGKNQSSWRFDFAQRQPLVIGESRGWQSSEIVIN